MAGLLPFFAAGRVVDEDLDGVELSESESESDGYGTTRIRLSGFMMGSRRPVSWAKDCLSVCNA